MPRWGKIPDLVPSEPVEAAVRRLEWVRALITHGADDKILRAEAFVSLFAVQTESVIPLALQGCAGTPYGPVCPSPKMRLSTRLFVASC